MKWFEQHECKDEQCLSPEQVRYLRRPSLNVFMPINAWMRQQWDILIAFSCLLTCLFLIGSMTVGIKGLLLISNIFVTGDLISFSIKHGRRLAWNRNSWKSFEEFQQSESKWLPCGIVGYVTVLAVLYYGLQHLFMANTIVPIFFICSLVPFLNTKSTHKVSSQKTASMPPPRLNEDGQ